MQGKKTHEQQVRILERKPDVSDGREAAIGRAGKDAGAHLPSRGGRESELPVSRGGVNQESDHNKHNHPGQGGHKPQQHRPAEQKD